VRELPPSDFQRSTLPELIEILSSLETPENNCFRIGDVELD